MASTEKTTSFIVSQQRLEFWKEPDRPKKMSCVIVCTKDVNVFVFILVSLFAISSWIDINGLWAELPILVQNLPEKWNLPSYMSVIIQIANIGPLAFTISMYIWPRKVKEVPVIYIIILVGATSCLLLAFFWKSLTLISGVQHSTALLTLQFFLALVDCTSSVAFYPYMALLKPQYMTALFIGESLSGLLPSLTALVQGAGQISCVNSTTWTNISINDTSFNVSEFTVYPKYQQPIFSIEIFFFFLMAMMLMSLLAFTLLNYLPYCKSEFISETDSIETVSDLMNSDYGPVATDTYELSDGNNTDRHFLDAVGEENSNSSLLARKPAMLAIQQTSQTERMEVCGENETKSIPKLCSVKFVVLSLLTIWVNALSNGVLPSVQSYSCLPYGNKPYHLAVTLSGVASPLACFMLFAIQVKRLSLLVILAFVGTVVASYAICMAILSPEPLLYSENAGSIIIICVWIVMTFILTFTKVSVASEFRVGGRKALLWCGVFTQVGSAIGAFVMFILINQLNYFKAASPCH